MKAFSYLLLILLLFTACEEDSNAPTYTNAERQTLDSMVQDIHSTDSLRAMLNSYQQSGNLLGQIVTLRHLGKRYRDSSMFMEALESHQEGLKLATQTNDTLEMIQALNNIGTNYRRLGSLEEAATFHQLAVLYSANVSQPNSQQAIKNRTNSLNGMGNVLMGLENYEHAEKFFRQALAAEKQLDSKLGQAINLANIGSIKSSLNQLDSARYYYEQSLEMNKQAQSQLGIGLCHIRFGELDEAEGQLNKAIDEYQKAYHILEQVGDDWHWMEAVLNIAHLCIVPGKTADAHTYLDMANKTTQRIGSQEQQAKVYELYYQLYEKTGNLRQALDNYRLATHLKDSLVNTKIVTNVQNQRIASERLRQEHQLQQANDSLALQRSQKATIIAVAIAILLVAMIIMWIMWSHFRARTQKQRAQQQLQQQREAFFTDIAYDFRTPLSAIISAGEQLEQEDLSNEKQVRSQAKMIVRQGNSLLGLINKMLEKT